MYCPKCATQNADDAKFCRSCGAHLSLVPQALTGQLPEAPSRRKRQRDYDHDGPASLSGGINKFFIGLGFLLVSPAVLFFAPAGRIWWFWLLLPAFGMIGKGIAEIIAAKQAQNLSPRVAQSVMPSAPPTDELGPGNDVAFPPPSVTEQTTRQLDPKTDPYRYRDTNKT